MPTNKSTAAKEAVDNFQKLLASPETDSETTSAPITAEIEVLPPIKNPLLNFTGGVVSKFVDRAFNTFVEKDRLPEKYQKLIQLVTFASFCWGFAKDVREQYLLLKDLEDEIETPTTRLYFKKSDVFYDLVKKWVRKNCPTSIVNETRHYNIFTGIEGEQGNKRKNDPSPYYEEDAVDGKYYPYMHLDFDGCIVPTEEKCFAWRGIEIEFNPSYKGGDEGKQSPSFNLNLMEMEDLDPNIQKALAYSSVYSEPMAELTVETDDIEVIKELFDDIKRSEAHEHSTKEIERIPVINFYDKRYNEWSNREEISMKRSVFLPQEIEEGLLDDVLEFTERAEWYEELGIPHKRGYLFYGLPGTGKTSTILAFAQHTKLHIYPIDLSKYTDEELQAAIAEVRSGIIIFEDIDCMIEGRSIQEAAGNKGGNKIVQRQLPTFSQFLNIIDGISGRDNQIIIMTTNRDVDDFDSALIRPGRIDVKVHFTYATDDQIVRLVDKFLKDKPDDTPRILSEIQEKKPITMCQVQEILIRETFGGKLKKIG